MESSTSLQFRGQTPECLKFGTSGLRGKVDAMTDLEVYINTTGFLEYLLGMHAIQPGDSVCLGGDLRPSTCLLYTSPSPRDATLSRMPSSA